MRFVETPLAGCYVIEQDRILDHRGYFARVWCQRELEQHGLRADILQANVGFSRQRGTLRGLHYQRSPHAEVKIVRCTRGAMFDVAVDLRPASPTFRQWYGIELTADNGKMLYVPEGFAQGYLTLVDDTEMTYQTTNFFDRESATGVRYNDPTLGILWPAEVQVISEQDTKWPDVM